MTIPAWLPEKVCWALSDEYHAPKAVGGHVRIYTENELRSKMRGAGLEPTAPPTTPTRCTRPTGGSSARSAPPTTTSRWCKLYHRLLVWDITERPAVTRVTEQLLNPVLGKSLVVYATKPVGRRPTARRRSDTGRSDPFTTGDRRCHCLRFPAS